MAELRDALNDPAKIGPYDTKRRDEAREEIIRLTPLTRPVVPTQKDPFTFEERRMAASAGKRHSARAAETATSPFGCE